MKFLKTSEVRELEKARKESERQQAIINEIEQKKKQRENKVTAIENKYKRDTDNYRTRQELFAVHENASIRFIKMIRETQWDRLRYSDYPDIYRNFRLSKLMKFLDDNADPPEEAPVKPEVKEVDLDD